MAIEKRKGKCEGCGNSPRVLTQIESGQWVCRTCLGEIRGSSQESAPAEQTPSAGPVRDEQPIPQRVGVLNHRSVRVAGVSHENRDGTDRQEIISRCAAGEILRLVADDDNPEDANAVMVMRLNGEQIGYLSRDDAADVRKGSKRGFLYLGIIDRILDDGIRGHCRGVGMSLVYASSDMDKANVREHVETLVKRFQSRG